MQEALKPLMMGSSDALRGSQDNSTNTLDQTQSQDMNVSSKNTSMPSPPASFRVVCETENSVGLQSSITDNVCRICHCESEPDAPLISPCVCAGSLRYVHQECLQQWIKSADTKSCELCKFDFHMTTRVKPFRKWQRLEMSTVERRKVTCSVTFHVIAITCVIWSLYVLIDRTTTEIQAGKLEWPFWTKLVVVAIGFTGGLVFMYVQCKMYTQLCRQWKAYNRVIYIEDYPEKNNSKPSSPTVCADMPIDRQGGDKIALSALTSPPEPINKTMVLPSQRSNRSMQESELL